jgi:hypothetical protein
MGIKFFDSTTTVPPGQIALLETRLEWINPALRTRLIIVLDTESAIVIIDPNSSMDDVSE